MIHRWLAALCLMGLALTASAHKSSDAYLSWRADGTTLHERIDVALRDLDRELHLDADDDGQLRWGEVRQRFGEIVERVGRELSWHAEGVACKADGPPLPLLDEHTDGRYAVLQRTWRCDAPVAALLLDYRLFLHSDATHRGIVRVGDGEAAVLVPGQGPQRLQLQPAAAAAQVRSFAGFIGEGLHHIVIGADHVLFLLTLLVVAVWRREPGGWVAVERAAPAWRETARLVTAFTAGHSLTLALASSGVLAPPSRWVESLIAISVFVAAIDNLRPFVRAPRWLMVLLFGLVHGFGFAGPLQDLGLGRGELWRPLLGFNLGVELGQLAIVALVLPLALALRHAPAYGRWVVRGGSGAVAALALVWTLERSLQLQLLP